MTIPFSPRAALCTIAVMAGLAGAVAAQRGGLFGLAGTEREGFLTGGQGGTAPDADERSEIVAAVLAHEARGRRAPVCLTLSDEAEALAGERAEIARAERRVAEADPPRRAVLIAALERLRRPERDWVRPGVAGSSNSVSAQAAEQLRVAETTVLATPVSGRVDIMLDMGSLPEILRGTAPGCDALSFTAPAVTGDVAFVETGRTCRSSAPAACGSGTIHALSRGEGGWRVEASAPTGIR